MDSTSTSDQVRQFRQSAESALADADAANSRLRGIILDLLSMLMSQQASELHEAEARAAKATQAWLEADELYREAARIMREKPTTQAILNLIQQRVVCNAWQAHNRAQNVLNGLRSQQKVDGPYTAHPEPDEALAASPDADCLIVREVTIKIVYSD